MAFREVKNARWSQFGFFRKRYFFRCGQVQRKIGIPRDVYLEVLRIQREQPVMIMNHAGEQFWIFGDKVYQEDEGLQEEDVEALVFASEQKKERRLERARLALNSQGDVPRRPGITREMRRAVWERDGGACVECGSTFDLQYDHILPHSKGGATTVENLQILCQPCNLQKSDDI
jgi:hypothetical protein